MTRQLNILVVDDGDMNRRLMTKFIEHLGHNIALAKNGLEAVDYCRATHPDIILMDVTMPVMDGFEATLQIRKLLGERWIPIIFLTALTDSDNLLRGLEVGGDDYLPKPVDLTLLKAKIGVLTRVADMQQRIASDAVMLEKYFQTNEQEQAIALHVLDRFTAQTETTVSHIQKWITPARNFSGDVICIAQSPTAVDHILLADSTGHGLAAAISCVPAADAFFTLTQQGFSISAIARQINQKLNMVMPIGRFLAAALIAIDYRERVIAVWNGGIPCAFYLNRAGQVEKQFASAYPPLGTLTDEEFESTLDVYRWTMDGELIVTSDGITEAFDQQETPFGIEGVIEAARRAKGRNTTQVIAGAVLAHLDGLSNHDDVSLVVADCSERYAVQPEPISDEQTAPHTGMSNWVIKLTFDAAQLREQDCFQVLIGWLNQLGLAPNQFGDLLLILTELFNNALDHGLLGLSSELKTLDDGFKRFMEERMKRLARLDVGEIEVGMARDRWGDRSLLRLWIRDSGRGFDHAKLAFEQGGDDETQTHGRGLAMIRKMAMNLRFAGSGNHIVVEYGL